MSESTAHIQIERGSARNFGMVFAAVFSMVAVYLFISSKVINYWVLIGALSFFTIAVIRPKLLEPLNFLWFKLGMLLGAIIAPLVMILVYFCVVTPTGLLMRLFGKDPLLLKRDPTAKTHWIERDSSDSRSNSLKNQF